MAARPPKGQTWKQIFIDEVHAGIPDADWARVHFLGRVPYDTFLAVLQVSRVHVYLTYPFVLSWSLIEAMSAECAILASDTAPVRDVIKDGRTGKLVNFFDHNGLADGLCALLDDPDTRKRLGRAARNFARDHFDLTASCLPRHIEWVEHLATEPNRKPMD